MSALLLVLLSAAAFGQSQPESRTRSTNLDQILSYIHTGWDSLTRSTSSCRGIPDSKVAAAPVVYLPADFPMPKDLEQMQHDCRVTVAHLPQVIHQLGATDLELDSSPWVALSQE